MQLGVLERGRSVSSVVAGCTVVHGSVVWSPQRGYQQRTVLGLVSTHVSSRGEVLRETVLQVNFVVVNVSDAPQLSARR